MSLDFPGINGPNNVINSNVGVTTGNTISVAIWFKPAVNDGGGVNRRLWSHGDKNNERATLFFMGGNKLAYLRHVSGGVQRWEMTAEMTKFMDWRCVVVTHDPVKPAGTNTTQPDPIIYVYRPYDPIVINKIASGLIKKTANTGTMVADGKRFRVGNSETARDLPFKGKIASFTVWSKVLTEVQVRSVIYRGDKTVVGDELEIFGWDMRLPAPAPHGPLIPPVPPPGTIPDWTSIDKAGGEFGPTAILGLTKVAYNSDNPPKRIRSGPYIVAE